MTEKPPSIVIGGRWQFHCLFSSSHALPNFLCDASNPASLCRCSLLECSRVVGALRHQAEAELGIAIGLNNAYTATTRCTPSLSCHWTFDTLPPAPTPALK
jgi:hypothetical protein